MTDKKEKMRSRLIGIGVLLIIAELIAIGVFFLWYLKKPQPLAKVTAAATVFATEEEIIYDSLPEENPGLPIPKNRFSTGDFQMQDGFMTCTAEPCVLGIDVSSYQGEIDWGQVKAAGIEFVMIRIGGRGYGAEGHFFTDNMADTYYAGAKAEGLQVGAYFFSQAITIEEALEEAQFALELTKDWELDLPLAYDWEAAGGPESRTANMEMRSVAEFTKVFCDTVRAAGREPMIYLSLWFGFPYLEEYTDYPIWLALYSDEMTYSYHFDMWQYTCSGTVPGIRGDVDVNIYFPPNKNTAASY